jgi:hypothetical protein
VLDLKREREREIRIETSIKNINNLLLIHSWNVMTMKEDLILMYKNCSKLVNIDMTISKSTHAIVALLTSLCRTPNNFLLECCFLG